jgi:hypothetical protein
MYFIYIWIVIMVKGERNDLNRCFLDFEFLKP